MSNASSPRYVNLQVNVSVEISDINFTEMSILSLLRHANMSTFHVTFGTRTHQVEMACSTSKLSKF